MKRALRTPLVLLIAAGAVVGTSIYAFAGWTTATATPVVLKVRVAAMPAGNTPSVDQRGHNAVLRWAPNRIQAGVPVDSYVVTRHGDGKSVEVCAVTTAGCKEVRIPAGKWTWTVRPKFKTWIGAESAPTQVFTFVGDPPAVAETADSLVVDPGSAAPVLREDPASPPATQTKPSRSTSVVTSPPVEPAPAPKPSQAITTEAPAPVESSSASPSSSSAGEGAGGTTGEGETTVGAPAEAEKKLQ